MTHVIDNTWIKLTIANKFPTLRNWACEKLIDYVCRGILCSVFEYSLVSTQPRYYRRKTRKRIYWKAVDILPEESENLVLATSTITYVGLYMIHT